MTGFGIICEFNPLHNGHKRLIDEARSRGADAVVCVMSGNAVQRGELAVADKYLRAKAAVLCGADLVIELPYPWSAASAEFFAGAGVGILSHFCDNVIFGSECGEIEVLKRSAEMALTKEFRDEYRARLAEGEGAASAYFSMLKGAHGQELSSNDILGVEYIRAAIEQGLDIKFHTVKREGAAYNEKCLGEDINPSASAIRSAWRAGQNAEKYMPKEAVEVFCNADTTDLSYLSRALLMYFRLAHANAFSNIAETEGGLVNRIIAAAKNSADENEFFEAVRTKRYTDAKLRRAMLFCLTGVTSELLREMPQYVTLLGADEKGRELLASARKSGKINVVTKPADAPRDTEQFIVGERLEAVFTLATKNPSDVGESYRKGAFIK